MEVLPSRRFYVLVSNISGHQTHLSKNTVVGNAHSAPAAILSVTDNTYTQVKEDVDITEKGVMKSKDKAPDTDWTSTIKVGEENEPKRNKIIEMLSEYATMWDGHLGTIKALKHRIELEADARPIHQVPYRSLKKGA